MPGQSFLCIVAQGLHKSIGQNSPLDGRPGQGQGDGRPHRAAPFAAPTAPERRH